MPLKKEINDSDILVIAATGYTNKLNIPVPQFFKSSGLEGASRIILIDPSKLKTLAGLPPDFDSFAQLLEYLEDCVASIKHKTLIVTGTSGGAHTALLLGHLLKADYVVSFSPYPYLTINEFKRMNDPALESMRRIIYEFDKLPMEAKQYLDLKDVLCTWNKKTEYYVHVSRYNKWDYKRAVCLKKLPGVKVIGHPYTEHAVASMLYKDDKLAACFSFPYSSHYGVAEMALMSFRKLIELFSRLRRKVLGRFGWTKLSGQ